MTREGRASEQGLTLLEIMISLVLLSIVALSNGALIRSLGSAGPSIPGIASWRMVGMVGTQFATASPCARRRARLAWSSSGSLNSQMPMASNPAAA